jgi:DNA-binding MarR family transcriptional regulator
MEGDRGYRLKEQVGFLLRRVNQRHLAVFAGVIPEVTTTQLAALAKLAELGPVSQNQLGRATAMDAATIKGVVGRLVGRRLVETAPSAEDRRRLIVDLTPEGRALFESLRPRGLEASRRTLAPLTPAEQARLLALLRKLV